MLSSNYTCEGQMDFFQCLEVVKKRNCKLEDHKCTREYGEEIRILDGLGECKANCCYSCNEQLTCGYCCGTAKNLRDKKFIEQLERPKARKVTGRKTWLDGTKPVWICYTGERTVLTRIDEETKEHEFENGRQAVDFYREFVRQASEKYGEQCKEE